MNLTRNQMTVLTILLDGDKYGLEVIQEAKESGVHLLLGSFYNVTTTLEKKGLVKSYEGKTTDERGGNNRRYYKITAAGEYELRNYVSGLSKFLNWINPKLNINLFGVLLFLLLLIPSNIMAANTVQQNLTDNFPLPLVILSVLLPYAILCILFLLLMRGVINWGLGLIISFVIIFLSLICLNAYLGLYPLASLISIGLPIALVFLVVIFLLQEKYAVKIITYFGYIIPRKRRKEIVGDLLEDYHRIRKEKNSVFAILVTLFHMVSLVKISIDRAKFSDYGSEVEVSKSEDTLSVLKNSYNIEEIELSEEQIELITKILEKNKDLLD